MDALPHLAPVSASYATLPVAEAFNWQDAATPSSATASGISSRSARSAGPDADEERLTLFDELAHQEAATSPGFVHYFKGPQATDGSCLSFCLWQSRADARAAAGRPDHVRAVSLIDEMYETLHARVPPRDARGRRPADLRAVRRSTRARHPGCPADAGCAPDVPARAAV